MHLLMYELTQKLRLKFYLPHRYTTTQCAPLLAAEIPPSWHRFGYFVGSYLRCRH